MPSASSEDWRCVLEKSIELFNDIRGEANICISSFMTTLISGIAFWVNGKPLDDKTCWRSDGIIPGYFPLFRIR